MILNAALAFIPGGVGGVVGASMKAAGAKDFMADGIKDLVKFGGRSAGSGLAALVGGGGIKPMPMEPLQWQNNVNLRVSTELALATKCIDEWQEAAEKNDPAFNANFDPVQAVDASLVIKKPPPPKPLIELQPVNITQLQRQFESGWLVNWINFSYYYFLKGTSQFGWASIGDRLENYGKELGVPNIRKLLNDHTPEVPNVPDLK
jgi:hypothetical protein